METVLRLRELQIFLRERLKNTNDKRVNMIEKFQSLAQKFCIEGEVKRYKKVSNGNINITYGVAIENKGKEVNYIFQKVNLYVFKNPKRVMENIEAVTRHMANKLEAMGKSRDHVMHFAHRSNGKNYLIEEGVFWRISELVPNSKTYNCCDNLDVLKSAGKAFGNFQMLLADFDTSNLYETIPNFHNTRSRIAVLMRHVNEDPCGRVCEVEEELAKIKEYKALVCRLNELVDSQEMPLRVTHNDTKINNILFDKDTGEAKTVIDLDTVMPGLVVHDFGDAIRFAANTAKEDEEDLSLVSIDLNRFRAFAEGFLKEVASSLTPIEIRSMVLGVFTMTVELAVRFLDDFITGDQYFKTLYRGHNLIRARCQLKLAKDVLEKFDDMNKIVSEITKIKI